MSSHKASLEKTLQSAMKHKKAGTEAAITILAVEALISCGIAVSSMAESKNESLVGRLRAALAHKVYGKRLADTVATLEAIQKTENLTVSPVNEVVDGAPYKQEKIAKVLAKVIIGKDASNTVADTINSVEPTVDALLTIYGIGGAKENASTASALQMIKNALID